jgi:hypothetical protein
MATFASWGFLRALQLRQATITGDAKHRLLSILRRLGEKTPPPRFG